VIDGTPVARAAAPFVARLQRETREAAYLGVPTDEGAALLLEEPGDSLVAVRGLLGHQVPYHASAIGKALLAFSPGRLERLLSGPLRAYTEHTLTTPAALLVELAKIREVGYAVEDLEYDGDVRSVGAPLFNHTGEAVAAISVAAPASRFSVEAAIGVGEVVASLSRELSGTLGFIARPAWAHNEPGSLLEVRSSEGS
jgi:DNA-binding IclR family transcriptional regulator